MVKKITVEQDGKKETLEVVIPFIMLLVAVFIFPSLIPVLGTQVAVLLFTVVGFVLAYFFFKPLFRD